MSRCTGANFRRARRREAGWWRAARPAKKKPRIGGGALNFGTSDSATLVRERRLGVRRVRRILLDTADEIERGVKRLVVLRIRRDIGLRAGLLVAFGLEVSAQRSFAARVSARFELLGQLLQHLDVGRNALRLDRAAGWGEVARGSQPERPIAGAERNDGLHRALAERARANDGGAPLISTMTGLFLARSPARALNRWVSSAVRPRVVTISPLSRNALETEIA